MEQGGSGVQEDRRLSLCEDTGFFFGFFSGCRQLCDDSKKRQASGSHTKDLMRYLFPGFWKSRACRQLGAGVKPWRYRCETDAQELQPTRSADSPQSCLAPSAMCNYQVLYLTYTDHLDTASHFLTCGLWLSLVFCFSLLAQPAHLSPPYPAVHPQNDRFRG